MFRPGELVEVREYSLKTNMTHDDDAWVETWVPAVIVECHGIKKLRTGIARFEKLEVVSVLLNGKVSRFPTRSIRYPRE
jgi:hypothetical protein